MSISHVASSAGLYQKQLCLLNTAQTQQTHTHEAENDIVYTQYVFCLSTNLAWINSKIIYTKCTTTRSPHYALYRYVYDKERVYFPIHNLNFNVKHYRVFRWWCRNRFRWGAHRVREIAGTTADGPDIHNEPYNTTRRWWEELNKVPGSTRFSLLCYG